MHELMMVHERVASALARRSNKFAGHAKMSGHRFVFAQSPQIFRQRTRDIALGEPESNALRFGSCVK